MSSEGDSRLFNNLVTALSFIDDGRGRGERIIYQRGGEEGVGEFSKNETIRSISLEFVVERTLLLIDRCLFSG